MPDKTSKDHQETLKFERYSGMFGCRTCANCHFVVNKVHMVSVYGIYAYCRYRTTGFFVEINRRALKPLHSCIVLLLVHIRDMYLHLTMPWLPFNIYGYNPLLVAPVVIKVMLENVSFNGLILHITCTGILMGYQFVTTFKAFSEQYRMVTFLWNWSLMFYFQGSYHLDHQLWVWDLV